MAHRIEVTARSIIQPYRTQSYGVKYVNTFARGTSWSAAELQETSLYGIKRYAVYYKRVAVVHVPHTAEPVTIPLKDCMRDPKVDSSLQSTLFLLPDYTYTKMCLYMDDYQPTDSIIKKFFGLLSQHKLVLRMDSLGHTVTTGYAEVYAAPSDFGPSLAPLMCVPNFTRMGRWSSLLRREGLWASTSLSA